MPLAEVRFFDTGHFALETHCDEIAKVIGNFLDATKFEGSLVMSTEPGDP
jgi:hypothetical protein